MLNESFLSPRDWDDVRSASGRSGHIPGALSFLTSSDRRERHDARFAIDNEAVRQSDRYEAAAYIISPLIDLLVSRPQFGRREIYEILTEIAEGVDMPGTTVSLTSGQTVPLHEACRLEFQRCRKVFLADIQDIEVGDLVSELVVAIDELDSLL